MAQTETDKRDGGTLQAQGKQSLHAAAPAYPPPPPNWLQNLRTHLDEHVFFWIALLVALYVFLFVPQVRNVWMQRPPIEGGFWTMVGFLIFLSFLVGFYGLSMFVVIRQFPFQWVQDRADQFAAWRAKSWENEEGVRWYLHPLYWFETVTWRSPDLCCRWLVRVGSNREGQQRVPKATWYALAASLVVAFAFWLAPLCGASEHYPLSEAFCHSLALLGLAAAAWLAVAIAFLGRGADWPRGVALSFGRVIAWLISTALVGEALWALARTGWWDNVISYRLYTIWALFQLLTTLVIGGLLIDRWHCTSGSWPVRQVALVLLPLVVWLFSKAGPVDDAELNHHLTPDQAKAWAEMRTQPDGPQSRAWPGRTNLKWFAHLNRRVKAVPESEPVVIVAASGGGSRAAIFTSLVLEALARTRTGNGDRTWADNVVLISSVSGGSLATAYHVERGPARVATEAVPGALLNTAPVELKHWGARHSRDLIEVFLDKAPKEVPVEFRNYAQQAAQEGADDTGLDEARQKAESALNDRLRQVLKERGDKEKALSLPQARSLTAAEAVARQKELVSLNDNVSALRTALALVEGDASLKSQSSAALGGWVWKSRAFDEMCIDFMAPLTRGALAPTLDRGDALARFWSHRYGWADCTNFSGYHGSLKGWNYADDQPAVVFNATDVARGSRLAVGFPPLPSDLWDEVYPRQGLTREVPRALNAPVSLARAVRMSSNFPFGFRALEFRAPPGTANGVERIHVLDGGVVDNTGLDTIYELLLAVEHHADDKNSGSPYHAEAADLLANLRRRGACVLEIDAGAKPNTDLPEWFNPLGGLTEQTQALENGGYSNADRAKQLYLKEVRRVLTQRLGEKDIRRELTQGLAAPDGRATGAEASLLDLEVAPGTTALHYSFQCNHYQPGERADPAIMTAWALGPRDKAEVVARFLPEVGLWQRRQQELLADIARGKDQAARLRGEARLRLLVGLVAAITQELQRISRDITELEKSLLSRKVIESARLAKLRQQFTAARARLDRLAPEVTRAKDRQLLNACDDLCRQLSTDDQRLAQLEKAGTPPQMKVVMEDLKKNAQRASQAAVTFQTIRSDLYDAEMTAEKGAIRLTHGVQVDPQMKYDQANRQVKNIFGQRSPPKGQKK